jgi:SAM-dependent methyltransferase
VFFLTDARCFLTDANHEQIAYWNQQAGPAWVVHQKRLDSQIRPHGALALETLALCHGQRVVDVGCGCGDSSLEIARRVGPGGEVLGLDLSEPMLARAQERASLAGLQQLEFQRGDAQYADLFVCWQAPAENPWVLVPMAAAAPHLALPPPPAPGAPGMFAFADAERVQGILKAAGYRSIEISGAHVPMAPGGGSIDDAVEVFLEVGPVASALRESAAGSSLRARVAGAVREAFASHVGDQGLTLDSAIWVVSAQRPPP